jgi:hypothetical protein
MLKLRDLDNAFLRLHNVTKLVGRGASMEPHSDVAMTV